MQRMFCIILVITAFLPSINIFAQEQQYKNFTDYIYSYTNDQVYCKNDFSPAASQLIKKDYKRFISICSAKQTNTHKLKIAYKYYLSLAKRYPQNGKIAYLLGMANLYNIGIISKDAMTSMREAEKWFKKSSDFGYPAGMTAYTELLQTLSPLRLRKIYALRIEVNRKAALKGLPDGYVFMIAHYLYHKDKKEVNYWLNMAKRHNLVDYPGIAALKMMFLLKGDYLHQDIPEFLQIANKILVNQKSGIHITRGVLRVLGIFYAFNKQYKNMNKALYYYLRAALLNDGYSQNQLANMYYSGILVKKDRKIANYWYCQAAKNATSPTHTCKQG